MRDHATEDNGMAGKNTLEFTQDNFQTQVIGSSQPVLVDFWAEWCPPCKALGPTIDEIADAYHGRAKVGKVNTDTNQSLAAEYGIQNIPTIIIFKNGEIRERLVGLKTRKELEAALESAMRA